MTKSRDIRDNLSRKAARAQGLLRYRSSKPCKNGHFAERLVSNGSCLECLALVKPERDRKHYSRHASKIKNRVKAWRKKHPEKNAEYEQNKRIRDPDKFSLKQRERDRRHKEKVSAAKHFDAFMARLEAEEASSC